MTVKYLYPESMNKKYSGSKRSFGLCVMKLDAAGTKAHSKEGGHTAN